MKILPYDKVQALKRSEKYRKDYQQYAEERDLTGSSDFFVSGEMARVLCAAGEKLCERWHIRFPVNPDAPYTPGEESCVHVPVTYLDPIDRWKRITSRDGTDGYKECITHINGKLVLMIDSAFSTDQIKAELDRILSVWTRETEKRAKKSKKADIWKIFDEMKSGKTFVKLAKEYIDEQVAKERITDPTAPQFSYLTETEVKLMQDSYDRACKIMAAVEKIETTVAPVSPMENKYKKPSKK